MNIAKFAIALFAVLLVMTAQPTWAAFCNGRGEYYCDATRYVCPTGGLMECRIDCEQSTPEAYCVAEV